VLEGTVTNVAAFGAFVDIGVHQDGLVHISAMSDKFVEDPRDVVRSGDVVRVKVQEVDEARKRISLTLRLNDDAPAGAPAKGESGDRSGRPGGQRGQGKGGPKGGGNGGGKGGGRSGGNRGGQGGGRGSSAPANSAMADALRRAGLN
jgi:uncharacterized protein